MELGGNGGAMLFDDLRFVCGMAPHPVYKEGKIIKRYTDVNPYTGKKTRVKFDKKAGKFVATKHQPKKFQQVAAKKSAPKKAPKATGKKFNFTIKTKKSA